MAERDAVDEGLTQGLVRAALLVRLLSLIVLLLLPQSRLFSTPVILAVGLVGAWSILFLLLRRTWVGVARRHPVLVLADVLLATTVTVLVGPDSPLVVATLSTALLIGVLLPRAFAALVTANLVLGYLLSVAVTEQRAFSDLYAVVLPMTFAVIAYLGNLAQRLHGRVLAEQMRSGRLAAQAAADAERSRLARDMHDSVAKTLHGVALAASSLPAWIDRDPDRAARGAADLHHAAEQASVEARELLTGLRKDTDEKSLAELLQQQADAVHLRTGARVDLSTDGLTDPSPRVRAETALVVGEALENVARHASASTVQISARVEDGRLEVVVRDDGRGFRTGSVEGPHFGIRGMRERAEALGGRLDVSSVPGRETRVTLVVPTTNVAQVIS